MNYRILLNAFSLFNYIFFLWITSILASTRSLWHYFWSHQSPAKIYCLSRHIFILKGRYVLSRERPHKVRAFWLFTYGACDDRHCLVVGLPTLPSNFKCGWNAIRVFIFYGKPVSIAKSDPFKVLIGLRCCACFWKVPKREDLVPKWQHS
jgi:hypothetical protein